MRVRARLSPSPDPNPNLDRKAARLAVYAERKTTMKMPRPWFG